MKFLNQAFFKGNRKKLSESVDGGLIVITAAGEMQKSRDTGFRFFQDSNFFYLCGINEPNFILVINGTEEFLISPTSNSRTFPHAN